MTVHGAVDQVTTHNHAHPAFGHGGDDGHGHPHTHAAGTASHDHEHEHDALAAEITDWALGRAGSALAAQPAAARDGAGCGCGPAPALEGVVMDVGPAHFTATDERAAVDNSTWDGGAAMSSCASGSAPASCYSRICAGRRTGDPALQSTWALPHHKHPGDPPNAAGVRNALSRLPQTDGLINKKAAQQHLEAHLSAINANDQAAGSARMRSAAIHEGQVPEIPNSTGRMQAFPAAHLRAQQVAMDGQSYYHVQGYATVFNAGYEMYDMWGPYTEYVTEGALDSSLARAELDTSFLTNHRGVTMARTTATFRDGTKRLTLTKDGLGLAVDAYLNAGREDVRTLVSAIDDELVTEMSFAFWLKGGHWDEDFEQFYIDEADIHRGDVSAVNYGANPYTSVAARATEILAALDHLPAGAARAAMQRLQGRPDVMVAF